MLTNYAPLDELVDKILSQITNDNMSTYEKVRQCYRFITDVAQYKDNEMTNKLYYSLGMEVKYVYLNDYLIASVT